MGVLGGTVVLDMRKLFVIMQFGVRDLSAGPERDP
jgi:hypothetical protein